MKTNLIFDMQYGSTGKGLLAGYLAEETKPDACVTCNMPNAGHTYIDSQGHKMIFKILPNGIVSPNLKYVFIGPGAAFYVERLQAEINTAEMFGYMDGVKVLIHPNAIIMTEMYAEMEREQPNHNASTLQGAGAARMAKIARPPAGEHPIIARDVIDNHEMGENIHIVTHYEWVDFMDEVNLMQAEGSQGFSLGINQRFYPFCTSRECTPIMMASDMGIPWVQGMVTTWGALRTFPIRVGNVDDGTSGSHYPDQEEVSWEMLGQEPETTTVTGRVRRVFTFSPMQLEEALWHCRPDKLFLNFCNYLPEEGAEALIRAINVSSHDYGCGVDLVGTGPAYGDVHEYTR